MKLDLREKSECFRGFLLLIAQDRVITPEERELLRHIGKVLDFDRGFCEEAMEDLLENVHIATTPPVFSRPEYAEAFLYDCIRIAGSDHDIHPDELGWLMQSAVANGITVQWVEDAIRKVNQAKTRPIAGRMEIEAFI